MESATLPIPAPLAGAACKAGILKRPKKKAISVAITILCIWITSHFQVGTNLTRVACNPLTGPGIDALIPLNNEAAAERRAVIGGPGPARP